MLPSYKNPNSSASILLSWELVHILVLGEDYSACLEFPIQKRSILRGYVLAHVTYSCGLFCIEVDFKVLETVFTLLLFLQATTTLKEAWEGRLV